VVTLALLARTEMSSPVQGYRTARGGWQISIGAILTLAMTVATFMQFAIGALAPILTAEFGLTRTALGGLTMVMYFVGVLFSPLGGTLVDRWGAR
jgi:MFS family permease